MFRNTGANAVAKNQTRLPYEDKRDLYCRHIREAITAGHAGIARRQRQGSSDLRRDWRTPQTHRHHVVGRTANSVRWHHLLHCVSREWPPTWTARNTSDDVRFSAVTNCCRTWTFDSISPASCCSCKAADRAFSLPM